MIGKNRVVITGLGVLAANGIGKEAFWNSLLAGESGIGPVTLFDTKDIPSAIAGEISNFNATDYIARVMKPKRMGRFTQFALIAATEAIRDSQLAPEYLSSIEGVPVVIGSSATAMDLLAQSPSTTTAVMSIPNAASSTVAYANKLQAQIQTVSNGCVSSLDAIAYAYDLIKSGKAEVAITGGADSTITKYVMECFKKARKLPHIIDRPEKACKPFDLYRSGGVVAEGAGIVVLETEEHALARNAPIYCRISGYGTFTDPATKIEGSGLCDSMRKAIENSGITIRDIDYISAHAPGDRTMDYSETQAIKSVFKNHAANIPITSIKGATGSAMGTGGVHQLIATVLSMKHQLIPFTTNYEHPDPDCDLDYVPEECRRTIIKRALVNSHGFGRSNGSIILEGVS